MQKGNIVVVSDAINRPAPRMVDAIERLARALHPEAFATGTAPSVGGGTGLSLWRFESAGTKPHRLKPAPLAPKIEEACACAR
jgi:hypothetical protein